MVDELEKVAEDAPTPKPIKRRKATADDIKPVFLNVEIEDVEEDGEPVILEYSMKVPAFMRWNQIGAEVPDPPLATIGIDATTKRPLYDTTSWTYRNALNDAFNERNIRRLAEALLDPMIPGDSLIDKATWIKENMSPGTVFQLCTLLSAAAAKGEARIASRANNFQ